MSIPKGVSSFALGFVTLVFAAFAAHADVTTEQHISVQGIGAMAFGNMSGTTRTAISGEHSRTDNDMKMESKLVRFLARNAVGPTAEIVLLDNDKLYHLNLNKKEYTEESFEDLRANMQRALNANTGNANTGNADAEERPPPSAVDQSKCEWLEPKAEVTRTGDKATIAGYDADHVVITAEQPCKDKETGAICEIALTLDEWLAPKFATSEEVEHYRKAYAQKLGLDTAFSQGSADRAKAMFSQYKGVWAKVLDKMKGLKGYPVKSSFSLALGGEQCKGAQSAQQQQASDSGDGSSGTPTSPADLAKNMGAKLGSFFHKKSDDSQAAAPAAPAPATAPAVSGPPGTIPLITVSSELVSVSTAAIPADAFTLPPGFKKVLPKNAT
jgi:hypothetical protein